MIVDRYYYHQLNKKEQAIYKAFYNGVMAYQEIIPIPVSGEFTHNSFEHIFMALTRDNPLIYFLNQSACSIAHDIFGHIAICPQYFFSKEKIKEYSRKIEKVVNELAGKLHLLECSDYEKELRVHDWICQNVAYDYEGTDKDKVSRVIASHNILGVFAYHKAQCEGIAKAVKVLLNAVDVKSCDLPLHFFVILSCTVIKTFFRICGKESASQFKFNVSVTSLLISTSSE